MGGGLDFTFGGPKGNKPEGPPKPPPEKSDDKGGGMDGARKDAAKAVARALGVEGSADLGSLDSALQAFVEACSAGQGPGYSEGE